MSITVREALQLPALRGAVLVAGRAGLDRAISSVNVMEVPEIWRWAKPDELLVSTTYPIKDDPEAQAHLVRQLADRGLAALAIKPVLYGNQVPGPMLRQADERGFPLIQLPLSASFDEIINPVLAEILNRQAATLRRSDEIHRRLTDLVLRGGGLAEIAAAVGMALGAPVSIHAVDWHLLAASPELAHPAHAAIRTVAADPPALRGVLANRSGDAAVQLPGDAGPCRVVAHPVTVAQEVYAHLLLWLGHDLDRRVEWNVVEQSAMVVALEIAKLRAVAEVEQRFQSSLVEDLLDGSIAALAEAVARGHQYGWNLTGGFVPVLLRADLPAGGTRQPLDAAITRRLRQAAQHALHLYAPDSLAVEVSDRLLLLLRWPSSDADADTRRAAGAAATVVEHVRAEVAHDPDARHLALTAGIGRPILDITQLRSAFDEATGALEVGARTTGLGSTTPWAGLGVYRLLMAGSGESEQRRFCRELLGPLVASDRSAHGPFLQTLEAVLAANGNLRQAARTLYVHYNTLRYRVTRIEHLTGLHLAAADDRLSLQVALKILRLYQDLSEEGSPFGTSRQ